MIATHHRHARPNWRACDDCDLRNVLLEDEAEGHTLSEGINLPAQR